MAADAGAPFRGSATHWGAFEPEVKDGRMVGVRPFEKDPDPSPMIGEMPEALYHEVRVDRPHVRKGYLEKGIAAGGAGRGAEPFVPVDWDTALDFVATKLADTVKAHGPDAVMGLSSARCTNEENYIFQKFIRAGVGTNNLDHCARL